MIISSCQITCRALVLVENPEMDTKVLHVAIRIWKTNFSLSAFHYYSLRLAKLIFGYKNWYV